RQNLFGGTLGGPVTLPRFGEGGRLLFRPARTFFFFSYEGLRLRQPQTTVTSLPSLRLRALMPAAARPLVDALPLPTGPEVGSTGLAPFAGNYSNPSTLNATSVRLDHSFSDRVTVFGRHNYAPSSTVSRSASNPASVANTATDTTTTTVGGTFSFTPRVSDELRLNYSRTEGLAASTIDDFGGAVPFPPSLYLPASAGPNPVLIVQFFSASFNIGALANNLQRQFNLVNNLSAVAGDHELKFGVDYRRLAPMYRPRTYTALMLFLGQAAVASGRPDFTSVSGRRPSKPVFDNFSAYGQDTWRPTRRLTLTYGLRWDLNPPPHEADGQHPFVVLGVDDPRTAALAPEGTPLWRTTYNNFAPRFGAAYALRTEPGSETMLRGGVGLFYDLGNGAGADAFSRGRFATASKNFFGVPVPLTPEQATPAPFPTNGSGSFVYAFDRDLKLPYTWQWNLTVEQSLGPNQTASAAYVAAVGRRQIRNRFFPAPSPNFQFLQIYDNGASSDYHSMQLQFQRRLSRGLQALASYTWSHAIDEVSDEYNNTIQLRGDADFDVRQNFSAAVSYNIPDPQPSGWASAILRNWSADAVVHSQSALPFTPFAQQFSLVGIQQASIRPNLVAGQPVYLEGGQFPGGRRLNPAAFQAPPAGSQGNVGRNSLRGFPLNQVDVALRRRFGLTERAYVEFRAEAFNVFNHPNFGIPVANMADPLFGQSTQMLGRNLGGLSPLYQIGGPRSLQFAVKAGF
ncbi:MAG TPA: TonB-dependent receptor, partial [Pyrinomonadaceae bacterium]